MHKIEIELTITDAESGLRLDQALSQLLPDYSRSRITQWIRDNKITVNGNFFSPKDKVYGGERVLISATLEAKTHWEGQELPLNIVFEDDHVIVVNKPIGVVVHPAAGNPQNTLVNALLHHHPDLAKLPRGGIIHRLDKDTSGLLIVAKTLTAHIHLVEMMQARDITREYIAVVTGVMTGGGSVDAPMARHPKARLKMAVVAGGKRAVTHYRVLERYRAHTLIRCQLETGRTHQIRVHMAHIHYPIVGDLTYGGRFKIPAKITPELLEMLKNFRHQALHAQYLSLIHPCEDRELEFTAELPDDMQALIQQLKEDALHE